MIYAIGDIHGCVKTLQRLLSKLDLAQSQLIFMGDYVDRGPSSRAVIEFLIQVKRDYPRSIFLMGNHDQMLLEAFHGQRSIPEYQDLKTILQWTNADGDRLEVPPAHLEFFEGLELFYETENYLFAHAGLDLLKPLEEQTEEDLLWNRHHEDPQGAPWSGPRIVYGHTPALEVQRGASGIGIDTGCCFPGKMGHLTALAIPSEEIISVENCEDEDDDEV